jgi:diguanylate cyclase (GGDEF)-like protein
MREALLIVVLVYALFTFSTLSVEGRFDAETLWMLQLAMIAGGSTTLTVIARNIQVRRDDIKARFELEKARDRMTKLSLKDPLTGAWNRRFLDQNFADIRAEHQNKHTTLQFAVVDIDDFKSINDTCGHDYGDLVLVRLAANFLRLFSGGEHLIRLGGDEFLLLVPRREPDDLIERGATALRTDPELFSGSAGSQVTVSIGMLELPPDVRMSMDEIYRRADEALYRAKASKGKSQRVFVEKVLAEATA